jgi:hypothetical protein
LGGRCSPSGLRQEERKRQPCAQGCRSLYEIAPGQTTGLEIFVRT